MEHEYLEAKAEHWPGLLEKIRDVEFAMLTTENADGSLHARPMATLESDDEGSLWFFTGRSTLKAREIEHHSRVNLAYVSPGNETFISVAGVGRLVADAEKAKRLWRPEMEKWFPKGLDDPDLVLLRVEVVTVEFWDVAANERTGLVRFSQYVDVITRLIP